jgi:RNA polymerase sigma-70 factor (ECF subfamily)
MLPYHSFTDEELLSLLKTGDQVAYTEIYHRYKAVLYIFAYKRIGQREEVRDLIHEVFIRLWEKHDVLIIKSLQPYLFTAVKNGIMDFVSHQQVAARYIDSFQEYVLENEGSTDHLVRHRELLSLIEREIQALPKKMRQVFELSRNTNYTRKKIAQDLAISEDTVKSHMHHALKILKNRLGPLFTMLFF